MGPFFGRARFAVLSSSTLRPPPPPQIKAAVSYREQLARENAATREYRFAPRHSGAHEVRTPNLEIPGSMLRIAPE
jgi:hypothetical protein